MRIQPFLRIGSDRALSSLPPSGMIPSCCPRGVWGLWRTHSLSPQRWLLWQEHSRRGQLTLAGMCLGMSQGTLPRSGQGSVPRASCQGPENGTHHLLLAVWAGRFLGMSDRQGCHPESGEARGQPRFWTSHVRRPPSRLPRHAACTGSRLCRCGVSGRCPAGHTALLWAGS